MSWVRKLYTKAAINAAGAALTRGHSASQDDLDVVNNWRGVHAFPLNTFQQTMRHKTKKIEVGAQVFQRMKRIYSIRQKLRRFRWITLYEMQDLGGCRAILSSVEHVFGLVASYENSRMQHVLIDRDDYITTPKATGYRSIHLIYTYRGARTEYNGRKIELQFRTQSQHVWATAVEMASIVTGQPLKSNVGDPRWLRFFQLMGTEMALREGAAPGPNVSGNREEFLPELKALVAELGVIERLTSVSVATRHFTGTQYANGNFFLLTLDGAGRTVDIKIADPKESLQLAFEGVVQSELSIGWDVNLDTVLIGAESLAMLEEGYPNYFLDTARFLEAVRAAIV